MATQGKLPDFNHPHLAAVVEQLNPAEIDSLGYGAIKLDSAGVVAHYSEAERRLSGSGERPRFGLDFYRDIAPCMNNDNFRRRIESALASESLDIEFTHIGDFSDADRELSVRVQSASGGGYWIFMRRN